MSGAAILLAALTLLPVRGDATGPEQLTVYTSNPIAGYFRCADLMQYEPAGSRCDMVFVWPWDARDDSLSAETMVAE